MNSPKDIPAVQPPLVEVSEPEYGEFLRNYQGQLHGNRNMMVWPEQFESYDFTVSNDLSRALQAYRSISPDPDVTDRYFIRKPTGNGSHSRI